MGQLSRRFGGALLLTALLAMAVAAPVRGFTGFGTMHADSTYGVQMTFSVALPNGVPDQLDLLLSFQGSDTTLVVPVQASGSTATYRWDAAAQSVTPNTRITYRWRATSGGVVTLSITGTMLYDDNRPGLNWRTARIGAATVHWYGSAGAEARRFGQLTANAASAAESLLGDVLAGPIDIFVYISRDEFFGALGPGAREWTGAATFPQLRTIFMWLGGGSTAYLETTITHEVTHVVFHDATDNPFHGPATWFNEGFATWAERQSADAQRATVADAASRGGLLAFDAIVDQFPIGGDAAAVAYAEGATMVQLIIDRYGRGAVARIAAAWKAGASDAEALQAGTGIPADQLYAAYFASFGVAPPQPVSPAPIPASNVDKPPQPPAASEPAVAASASPTASAASSNGTSGETPIGLYLGGMVVVAAVGGVWWRSRRSLRAQ
jgi:Peptidase MA superfamily